MSTFAATAHRITLHPIENADRLELARPEGTDYYAVVQKGLHEDGDVVVYIPEGAVVTDEIIEEMGLVSEDGKTMLAGGTLNEDGTKKRNRVKALKLRGQLSQGLIWKHDRLGPLVEGEDYTERLGVAKYEPPVPTEMAGEVHSLPYYFTFDVENIKNHPNVFADGEPVVATEKLHGTCSIFLFVDGEFYVSSKNRLAKGLGIIESEKNVYWRMARAYGLREMAASLSQAFEGQPIAFLGETIGVQDLRYGLPPGALSLRMFDVRVGDRYLPPNEVRLIFEGIVPLAPVLYEGPFDREKIEEVATGRETITGKETHVREGVVVRPEEERTDETIGRAILKVVSPKYLLRKGDATEFE